MDEANFNQPLLDNISENNSKNNSAYNCDNDDIDFNLLLSLKDKISGPSIEDESEITKLYDNDSDDEDRVLNVSPNNNPYRGIRNSLKMELLARKSPIMLTPLSKSTPNPDLNHLIDMGVIVHPNKKEEHECSAHSHSLYKGDVTIEEWNKLSQFESLDYQTCHNSLHKRDISKLTQQDYTNDSIQRWIISCFIGAITGVIAFAVHYTADIIQEKKFIQTF